MKESNAYILGTDTEELHRLGLQHQVWSSEAQKAWKDAGLTAGQTILDLGCGPGFCTRELAYIAGKKGKVIGIDLSENYIHFLQSIVDTHDLKVEAIAVNFNDMVLEDNSIDAMYCRWAMAWVPNPAEVIAKVYKALKPGGRMIFHEYYDWSTHQTQPQMPYLSQAIAACLKSFKEQAGDIDIGRNLPEILSKQGMRISRTRPMAKLARPGELEWQWPRSFYEIYFFKLIEMGLITEELRVLAMKDLEELEHTPGASLCCPLLIEVIAEK
ncbi:MAG: methyltransferase domain-containing protein [Bacteroidia bacterium]